MMIQYVRRGKSRIPFGTMTAQKLTNTKGIEYLSLGWSICNKKDTFFKSLGKGESMYRAREHDNFMFHSEVTRMDIPSSFVKKFERFAQRASAYFQTKQFQNEYFVTTTEITTKEEKINV